MLRSLVFVSLIMISCNDSGKADLFELITNETCECSKQQNIAASAAILKCMMQSAVKHDDQLKNVGVDQNSEAGLKQLQFEVAGRMESQCREIYMKALEERRLQ